MVSICLPQMILSKTYGMRIKSRLTAMFPLSVSLVRGAIRVLTITCKRRKNGHDRSFEDVWQRRDCHFVCPLCVLDFWKDRGVTI